jgi:hypothetical protein
VVRYAMKKLTARVMARLRSVQNAVLADISKIPFQANAQHGSWDFQDGMPCRRYAEAIKAAVIF